MNAASERADLALRDAAVFCNLLAAARQHKAPHTWEGSAFRRHPCGLVVETIKLTNHWHVDNLCDIAITDGIGWDRRSVCTDPAAHGDPHPRPIEGCSLVVWRCGRWTDDAYMALRPRVLEILTSAAEFVARVEAAARAREQAERASAEDRRRQVEQRALAIATSRSLA